MPRFLAGLAVFVIVTGAVVAGYLSGARDQARPDQIESQRSAQSFYAALNQLEDARGIDQLASLLAPNFSERRIDLLQTLDRRAFLSAIEMEHQTFPNRTLMPIRISSEGAWAMVLLQTVDDGPGTFAGVTLPASSTIRREMLNVVDGQVVERIVLEGSDSSFWSLPMVQIPFHGIGPQTIDMVSRAYAPHAHERTEWKGAVVLIARVGQFTIDGTTLGHLTLDQFSIVALTDPGSIEITNVSDESSELAMILVDPVETPRAMPDGLQGTRLGTGVDVRRVAQSAPLFSSTTCVNVSAGLATLSPGDRLPSHDTSAYEIVVPVGGFIDARNDHAQFLRSDLDRSWQDLTSFAALAEGISVVAPPGSRTDYVVMGNQPATMWLASVQLETSCSV